MPFNNTTEPLKTCIHCGYKRHHTNMDGKCTYCRYGQPFPMYDDNKLPIAITKHDCTLVLNITRESHLMPGDDFLGGIVTGVADYFGPYWIDFIMPDSTKKNAIVLYD